MKIQKTIIICDDSKEDRADIRNICMEYFKERDETVKIVEFSDGKDLINHIIPALLIFLDIDMKYMNGIDVKKALRAHQIDIPIIFLTNYEEYMKNAFGKNVYGYLYKPPEKRLVQAALNQILEETREPERVTVRTVLGEVRKVRMDRIYYIQAEGCYSVVHCSNEYMVTRRTLISWLEELPDKVWVKSHRAYLVNLGAVSKLSDDILLVNYVRIPVSRKYRKNVFDAYQRYIEERWSMY